MKYLFVKEHAVRWPIAQMCRVLSVSTSGYYGWRKKPCHQRFRDDEKLRKVIHTTFYNFKQRYGSPRIFREMRSLGYRIGRKRVERLMREMNLHATPIKRFVHTTNSNHDGPIADNLLNQDFIASQPNEKWVGDITYIDTAEGWLYLATVIDLYSRKVVRWAFSVTLERDITMNAIHMAVFNRQPPTGVIFHSDRGSQYASNDFIDLLNVHGIRRSMSAKGCCYDNAVAESFFRSLKVEEVYRQSYATRADAERHIFQYIEGFYNTTRRHSTIDHLSPNQFEKRLQHAA